MKRGEHDWVNQIESFDKFCAQACDEVWRLSAGENNKWALYIPEFIHTVTTRIGHMIREHAQSVADEQMTMMPELMRTLELEETEHPEWDHDTQEAFKTSMMKRMGVLDLFEGVENGVIPNDPFSELPSERKSHVSGYMQNNYPPILDENGREIDPDMDNMV